ncbi:hypothetical protein KC573_03890, partial [candidate division WWE3 bacterium]|nr:hypothetical protein [candidate division WWE3 bacterium]
MAICHEDTSIADVQNIQFHSYASTTNHVSFEAGTNKYFASVLGPYISRNNLEFEVKVLWSLGQMGFPSVRVAQVASKYVHRITVDRAPHSVIFYEFLEGELIPYNQLTLETLQDIFSRIAELHTVLASFFPIIDRHGIHYRKSRYTNIVMALGESQIEYLLKRNFNSLEDIKLKGIREKWDSYSHLIPKVREYLVNKPRQITHGDLSQANILVV